MVLFRLKKKCVKCGMIRSSKDLVKLENQDYICFHCWNKKLKEKINMDKLR